MADVFSVDMDAASRKGITVCRAAGANARGVAELAFGLIMALIRSVPYSDQAMKQQGWQRRKGLELAGRTLGLVGCGAIGKSVARFALAFDMNTFEGLLKAWCRTSVIKEPDYTVLVESSFRPRPAIGQVVTTGFLKEGRRYRRFEEVHRERGYHPEEIDRLLEKTGFTFRKYDGISLGPSKKKSSRLIYICRRAGGKMARG